MIAVVDYGLGNVRSVVSAVSRLGHAAVLTRDPGELALADKLILPGVGAFGEAMERLRAFGLVTALRRLVEDEEKPILGICLGMQLLCEESLEFGRHEGLGWIPATVRRLEPGPGLRLPHVGWNELFQTAPSPLFAGIPEDALFYHVHSYYPDCRDPALVVGESDYGGRFPTCLQKGHVFGVQFHPEKSQRHGLTLLGNFLALDLPDTAAAAVPALSAPPGGRA